MSFVFYDVETTGLDRRRDQILGFAAVVTDQDLVETDRFETECRLMPHVVPHPDALRRNGLGMAEIAGADRRSHFEMMCEVHRRLEAWGPALYVGYNSIAFDEEFLRQAFFLTLHPPYLTSMPGSGRADALTLVRTVACLRPGALMFGMREGRRSFRLEDMCSANEVVQGRAHTAMADAVATAELCRRAREADEETWDRFVRNSTKSAVAEIVDVEAAFLLVTFVGNDATAQVLASVATDETNGGCRLCLPVTFDHGAFSAADDHGALAMLRGADGLRRVRTNRSPVVCVLDEAPPALVSLGEARSLDLGRALRERDDLRERVLGLLRVPRRTAASYGARGHALPGPSRTARSRCDGRLPGGGMGGAPGHDARLPGPAASRGSAAADLLGAARLAGPGHEIPAR